MTDVFISYKSERRPAADHLAAIIAHYGFEPWVDYEGLRPGEGYAQRLERKIKESPAVLVLWCKMAIESPWVRKEAAWARAAGSYIPVWLEEAVLPPEFADGHTLNLRGWNGAPMDGALAPLIRAIGARVGREPQPHFDRLSREQQTWERYGRQPLAQFALSAPANATPETGDELSKARAALRVITATEWLQERSQFLLARVITASSRTGLEALAAEGDPRAQCLVGRALNDGLHGFTQDEDAAVRFYRRAADQNDARAQSNLAFMYAEGRGGLRKDEREAVRLYRLSAAAGFAWAQQELKKRFSTW